MPDKLLIRLNTPPVRPSKRVGANADTNDHVMEAKPLPKKASAKKIKMAVKQLAVTKLTPALPPLPPSTARHQTAN